MATSGPGLPSENIAAQSIPLHSISYCKRKEMGMAFEHRLTVGRRTMENMGWKIENKYNYKIIAVGKTIPTALGELSCAVVKSTAKSRLGKTELTAYYHDDYGFVKMEYKNIDGSRIVIDLIGRVLNSKQQHFYH